MPDENEEPRRRAVWGNYLTLGLQLAASMVVFMLAGIWADTHWGISPWGTIGGLVLGATGALVKFIRTAMELGKAADAEAREAHTKR